jgi:hypothetical protein
MTQRPPPRGNPTPAQILAAAKKVRAPGHQLAGRKTYVPTPMKRHSPRATPGAASYPKGVRYGYPDPRVWAEEVRDNPTRKLPLATQRRRLERHPVGSDPIHSITVGTVPMMSTGDMKRSLEMALDDVNAETVRAYRVALTDRLEEVRAMRRAGKLGVFGASMESGAAGSLALATEYLKRTARDNPTLAQVRAAASRGASAAARGARSAYAYAAPRAKAAARATAAAAKRGAKRAAPHVARGARAVAGRLDAYAARENPSRGPIDHKFAGSLFSAGEPKVALAYLRGTMAKGTARELVAAKLKKARR